MQQIARVPIDDDDSEIGVHGDAILPYSPQSVNLKDEG
jgi:hypothetical protein